MNRSSLHIIWLGLFISLISVGSFLSVLLHLNIYILALILLAGGIVLHRYISKKVNADLTNDISKKSFLLLSGGILLMTAISCILVREHGETDAIGNWNFAAKYLADTSHWKQLLTYSELEAHPDYPMGYFGTIAFFWRLFGSQNEIVTLALTLFATIGIPAMIFLELCKKHLAIATVILLLFAINPFYLNCGLNQYADTLLSFYILAAFITMNHFKESGNKIYLLLCTASLGAAIWLKNEGAFTCFAFGAFYFRTFLSKDNIRYSILGALPFLLALAIFKIGFAPANDIISSYGKDQGIAEYLVDKTRYKLIAQYFLRALDGNSYGLKLLAMLYLGYSLFAQKNLSRNFYLVSTILVIYLSIYIITPQSLEWFLLTSLERLLIQLYPAFLLIMGLELAKIRIPQTSAIEQK